MIVDLKSLDNSYMCQHGEEPNDHSLPRVQTSSDLLLDLDKLSTGSRIGELGISFVTDEYSSVTNLMKNFWDF